MKTKPAIHDPSSSPWSLGLSLCLRPSPFPVYSARTPGWLSPLPLTNTRSTPTHHIPRNMLHTQLLMPWLVPHTINQSSDYLFDNHLSLTNWAHINYVFASFSYAIWHGTAIALLTLHLGTTTSACETYREIPRDLYGASFGPIANICLAMLVP